MFETVLEASSRQCSLPSLLTYLGDQVIQVIRKYSPGYHPCSQPPWWRGGPPPLLSPAQCTLPICVRAAVHRCSKWATKAEPREGDNQGRNQERPDKQHKYTSNPPLMCCTPTRNNKRHLPRRATRLSVSPRWPARANAGKTASARRCAPRFGGGAALPPPSAAKPPPNRRGPL